MDILYLILERVWQIPYLLAVLALKGRLSPCGETLDGVNRTLSVLMVTWLPLHTSKRERLFSCLALTGQPFCSTKWNSCIDARPSSYIWTNINFTCKMFLNWNDPVSLKKHDYINVPVCNRNQRDKGSNSCNQITLYNNVSQQYVSVETIIHSTKCPFMELTFMNFNDYTINKITWSAIRDLRVLSFDCKAQNTKPITTPVTVRTAIFGSPETIQTLNYHTVPHFSQKRDNTMIKLIQINLQKLQNCICLQ